MRVGIDVSILSSQFTGIGRFTFSLVRSLASLREHVEWVLLGAPPHLELPDGPNVTAHQVQGITGWRRATWQQIMLPRLVRRYGLNVLHCPDFSRPVSVSVPVVNTIHDLSYYSSGAYFSRSNRAYKRALTQISVRKSSRLVADSRFTRDELVHRFGLEAGKIPVIYLGTDYGTACRPFGGHRPPLQMQEGRPFVLYVGTIEERKNLPNLIRGFALMRAQTGAPHRLALAGKPGRGFNKIQAAIRGSTYANQIDVLGYVDEKEVLDLYLAADAVAMPSFCEGFGFPVLEAMSLGTPVVCSQAASLPEVGGDAVEYFDPASPEEIAAVLTRVLSSESLRFEMRRSGLERAKQFTWDECAGRYCDVYKEVATK